MAISAAQLIGLVEIRGADTSIAKLASVGAATDSAGAKLAGLAAGGAVLASAAFLALGAKVTTMAGNFQSATETLVTGAGEQQSALDRVRQGILKTAVDTATGTKPLIDAMFMIESAGYRGAAGLTVLKDSAEEAKVGNADLGKVADVLTTVMHNYHLGVAQAVPVLNSFNKTVGDGKMYLDQLDAALTNVLPAASKAGVKFTDVEGALATMSESGDKGAAAGTHLSQMFLSLEKPTSAATKVLKEVGLTTQQISDDMKKSLPDTIQLIYDALAKKFPPGSAAFNAAAATIVGGTRQMKAWNELTGQSFTDLVQKTADISAAYKKGGQDLAGWSAVQDEFNFKLDRGKEVMETLGIKIGTALLPVLGKVLDNVTPLVSRFSDWISSGDHLTMISQGLSTALSFVGNTITTVVSAASWLASQFTDAGVKGQLLRDVLVIIGTTIAGIKAVEFGVALVTALQNAGLAAQGLGRFLLGVQTQATLTAGAETAAGTAATGATTALSGMVGPLGLLVAGLAADVKMLQAVNDENAQFQQAIHTSTQAVQGFSIQNGKITREVQTQTQQMADGTTKTVHTMVDSNLAYAKYGSVVWNTQADNMNVHTVTVVKQMATDAITHVSQMALGMQGQMSTLGGWMANEWGTMQRTSLTMSQTLSDDATKNFDKLKGNGTLDMSQLDDSAKGYWNDVANYIATHPITGEIGYVMNTPSFQAKQAPGAAPGAVVRQSAEGWFNSPGGWSWTGERGRELLYVPPGASIIPHQQSERIAAGGSAQPVTIIVNVAGHQIAQAFLPDLVTAIRNHVGVKF